MLGWINDCIEKLVISEYDVKTWHIVKSKAGCTTADDGFLKLDHYPDKSTIDLVVAASEVSGLTVDQVLEAFGKFFVPYIIEEGYESLLCCQGSTMKDWMTNINAIHQHLQTTFPKKMIMPEFWCQGEVDGSLTLYYHSMRGSLLAPLAVGLVCEVATRQFELDLVMDKLTTQDVEGAKFTSWKVTTRDPEDLWKLRNKKGIRNGVENDPTSFRCPFTGMSATLPAFGLDASRHTSAPSVPSTEDSPTECGNSNLDGNGPARQRKRRTSLSPMEGHASPHSAGSGHRRSSIDTSEASDSHTSFGWDNQPGSLSSEVTRKIFPYHVMINYNFDITQVGSSLPRLLSEDSERDLIGVPVGDILKIAKPMDATWEWGWLRKLEDQTFTVELADEDLDYVRFNASVVHTSESRVEAMLVLSPDANNLDELRGMRLTLSDLPAHGAYRDAVFLREHLSTQMNNALRMEKLSRNLEREKALLEELLPEHAAEGLRKGQTVEPMIHPNVTMFFSDVVGFTSICKKLYPWEVIAMLNRLYSVMDFLAKKFKLFKVETIGDAYVCCSGLPESSDEHAQNVANFALAVQHCSQMVLSPVDNTPIQLRIGIHTGPCASGVVGVMNPRYCVFGDTVNTTSRFESTGLLARRTKEPGKVHCSSVFQMELLMSAGDRFQLKERGMVEMKGKGEQKTFWLEPGSSNKQVNRRGLMALQDEVREMLESTKSFEENMQKMLGKTNAEYSDGSIPRPRSQIRLFEGDATATKVPDSGKEACAKETPSVLSAPNLEKPKLRTIESASVTEEDSSVGSSSLETSSLPSLPGPARRTCSEKPNSRCPHARLSQPTPVPDMYFM